MLSKGLKNSLNAIRELSSKIYHQYIPVIDNDTDISQFASPILSVPEVQNEFISALVNRIVYTQFEVKYFNNKLKVLEGDRIPLGYAGQEIYTNPAKARQYNVNDFAGLLQKYESDTKVQYMTVNTDLQYCVSIARHKLKQAFVSWEALDNFIANLTNSLYNGAYIDSFQLTKALVSSAYKSGHVNVQVVQSPSTPDLAKAFITSVRSTFLDFQLPSTNYNAWGKVDTEGRPITTWSDPDDVVFLIRNDVLSYTSVNVLASAFNMNETDFLSKVIAIDNFNVYNDDGTLNFDGSAILGMIADKSWFRIKEQDMYLDEFYNANNRVWQYYLNVTKMYQYSLFANAVVFATTLPETSADASTQSASVRTSASAKASTKASTTKTSVATPVMDAGTPTPEVTNTPTPEVTDKTNTDTTPKTE